MSDAMTTAAPDTMPTIDEIIDNFSLLDEWDDRYRYVIELGRDAGAAARARPHRGQQGAGLRQPGLARDHACVPNGAAGPVLTFVGDSDAHIVRGLIAILFALFSGKPAREILATDAIALFERLGLREHLTPQRSNGFRSMVERIRSRRARGAGRRRLLRSAISRRRRCWPSPICLASCERAAA